ncbi:glutamate receptor 4-like [Panulirus ornatus]|uniref:glutamate receptor 4-like n=1 Tax=Panulirus ornatus TaxID=150431 RepID=UPI003A863F09
MIVVAVYSGNLTAFLSIPIISKPPSTIRQLVTRDWTIRLDKAYGTHDLVKETKTEDYQTLYKRAKERGSIFENFGATVESKTDINELKKDIALVMGETGAFYTLNKNARPDGGCTLAYSQEAMGKEYAALALPKQSLLKPVFDKKLRWMRQMGVLHKYYDDSFGVKCHQSNLMSSEPSAMTLSQLLGVFYVWAGGVGIACLVFLGEVFAGTVKGKN